MKRRTLLTAVFGLAAMGASPRRSAPILSPDENFPLPPVPPAKPPAFQAAPVPDLDLSAPAQAERNSGPEFSPNLFNQRAYNGGQGYTPGSSIERQQQQRQLPVPGFNLKMPLQ
jgi:hypothetical protein